MLNNFLLSQFSKQRSHIFLGINMKLINCVFVTLSKHCSSLFEHPEMPATATLSQAFSVVLGFLSNIFMLEVWDWRKHSLRKVQTCSLCTMPCPSTLRPRTNSSRPSFSPKIHKVRLFQTSNWVFKYYLPISRPQHSF